MEIFTLAFYVLDFVAMYDFTNFDSSKRKRMLIEFRDYIGQNILEAIGMVTSKL